MNNLENLVIYFSNLSAFYIFSIAISVAVVILTVYLGWITRSEDAAKNYDPMEDHSKVQNECEESSEDESLRIESMGQLKSARIRSLENTLTNEQREEEKKIECEQLAAIFELLKKQNEDFSLGSDINEQDLKEQLTLYR
ncbi:matrix-remodeling-associated protein 7 isoform X2 [Uranotaenia lowii]|uniref:matrix-remodeling-associated protein 7 isoform X2 n=1 Tax=Uranotaenia lowii TaxID=190385 RepID=UPI0024788C2D|nr:matrix-remodeling-associated protein 7 isoform X2 [Uranotaenia lowii]